jgi:outer membrane protein W
LTLTTGRGLAASQGPGLTLEYKLNDKWKLGLTGRYEKIRFALNNDATSVARYGEDKSLPLVLSAQYTLWPMTTVGAFVGGEFEGKLSVEDANARALASSEYDPPGLIGLVFRSRF